MSKTTANADEQELVTISLDNDCIRVHPAAQSKSQRTTALQLPYGPLARRMLECLDLGLIPPVLAPALGPRDGPFGRGLHEERETCCRARRGRKS